MKMSNQPGQCPGLKLGHQKKTIPPHYNPQTTTAEATDNKRIIKTNYVGSPNHTKTTMGGYFRLPEYEPSRLERLPATQQNLFRPEQLTAMLEDFSRNMYEAIEKNHIQVPPGIELGLNSMGNIFADESHPMQMKIEQLFNITPLLEQKFHQIAFTSRVQQLADLQPSFRGEFFKLAPQSVKQITLVQMRSVELKPFRLFIERADPATPVSGGKPLQPESAEQRFNIDRPKPPTDKQHQAIIPTPFRLIIARPEETTAPTDDDLHANEAAHRSGKDKLASPPIKEIEPPEEERRHVHKGRLRCIIKS